MLTKCNTANRLIKKYLYIFYFNHSLYVTLIRPLSWFLVKFKWKQGLHVINYKHTLMKAHNQVSPSQLPPPQNWGKKIRKLSFKHVVITNYQFTFIFYEPCLLSTKNRRLLHQLWIGWWVGGMLYFFCLQTAINHSCVPLIESHICNLILRDSGPLIPLRNP